jgi:FixJ family two-component response regulator
MDYSLALITQDRGLEKVMKRISSHFGYELSVYEDCADFVKDFADDSERGVVIVDASICSQPRLMDLQMVLNEAPAWRVVYLPRTHKKEEVKEAMGLGTFGCLHKPVSEQEVRQMVVSALGI